MKNHVATATSKDELPNGERTVEQYRVSLQDQVQRKAAHVATNVHGTAPEHGDKAERVVNSLP